MIEAIAKLGLQGASMSEVARRAGVATGTAYVHYEDKDELVRAAYTEAKTRLAEAALAAVQPGQEPREAFTAMWLAIFDHLSADPVVARFLAQMAVSPMVVEHEDDTGLAQALVDTGLASQLLDVPGEVLYDLALGPAIRLAASDGAGGGVDPQTLADACWRAVARN